MRCCGGGVKALFLICDANPPEPVAPVLGWRHTASMAIRYAVQADTEDECVEGLAKLVDAGMQPVMMPRYMTDGRWMARAVPTPARRVEPADR